MNNTSYYSWPRRLGKSWAVNAWREAQAKQADSGAGLEVVPVEEYVAFFHSDMEHDLRFGHVETFRFFTTPFGWPPKKMQRSGSTRKRARALKWRRSW